MTVTSASGRRWPDLMLRLSIVELLLIAQMVPLTLSMSLLPTILRDRGASLDTIALLSIATVPTWIKWVFGPVVDGRGPRRAWILTFALLGGGTYLALGYTDLGSDFVWIVAILALANLLMMFFDIAVDGYTVESFDERDRRFGAVASSLSPILGNVIVFTGLVAIYEAYGWSRAMEATVGLLVICALAVLLRREPRSAEERREARADRAPSLRLFFMRRDWKVIAALMIVFSAGMQAVQTLTGPFLIDKGLEMSDVGIILGVFITGAIVLGNILSVALAPRLGPRGMAWLSIVATIVGAVPLAILLAWPNPSVWEAGGLYFFFVLGLMPMAFIVNMARLAWPSKGQAGTDYTVIGAFAAIGNTIGPALGGVTAERVGYEVMFGGLLLVLVGAPIIYLAFERLFSADGAEPSAAGAPLAAE